MVYSVNATKEKISYYESQENMGLEGQQWTNLGSITLWLHVGPTVHVSLYVLCNI